ncbi:MAG: ABC transporter ATP-binding protein [Mollicutes bacterium]|nr:ABC transporter ATP-binding protein [Mollicutes bacterium]
MSKEVIKIKNLSKYYGNIMGVKDINLTINQGEIFGFIGPNGAGKSTTIRAMLNFLFPTSGKIEIFGLDSVKDSNLIKEKVGYVPSEVNYYDYMKVRDLFNFNKSLYPNVTQKEIDRLCKLFDLNQNRKINKLSFGNKKKVAIIQALMFNPQLLIFDEPTNGLDPLIQNKLFDELLTRQKQGVTIFLSSHNLREVEKYCDRVGIVRNGKIIDVKKIDQLNNKNIKKVVIKLMKKINLSLEGISDLIYKNKELSFKYKGEISKLLNTLSEVEVLDVNIIPLSLEEDFLDYYGE